MRVLVVDDAPENVYMLQALLQGHGYEVATASNGLEALEQVRRSEPGLIISDILMPKMDGFQLCRAVKADERAQGVPFIFYTATYTSEKDREFALGLGASRFVLKPTEPEAFMEIVRAVLAEHRDGRLAGGRVALAEETEYLREHQARLIRKLEDKVAALERAEARARDLNAELEARVRARTRELEDALRLADAASRAKSVFLASMSHELRTPLNAIIGFSEVLQDELAAPLHGEHREYAANIQRSGRHLLALINDILDLAKVEAGKMELDASVFPLRPVLEFALATVRDRAVKQGLALALDLAPEADRTVVADERKLKQILTNLLSNAVKFTPSGGSVRLGVRAAGAGIELSVADTGVGIAAEDMPRLFQEFTQLNPSRALGEGTGLGLALTRRLVELHGGTIRAESAAGRGSTFTVVLPA